jgi:tyrosinase
MDGSPYSQGGNGVWKPHNCTRPSRPDSRCLTPVVEGRGGGCVETGPYVGIEANLSTVDSWFNWPNEKAGPWLGYQPRCMSRDISPELTSVEAGDEHLLDLLTNPAFDTIGAFQGRFQAGGGLHAQGHFTYSGNPGGDVRSKPLLSRLRECRPCGR